MRKTFFALVLILCISNLTSSILIGIKSMQFHNKEIEYDEKIKNLEYQLKTTKESFDRQIDTCLDIIVNERWN